MEGWRIMERWYCNGCKGEREGRIIIENLNCWLYEYCIVVRFIRGRCPIVEPIYETIYLGGRGGEEEEARGGRSEYRE